MCILKGNHYKILYNKMSHWNCELLDMNDAAVKKSSTKCSVYEYVKVCVHAYVFVICACL